MISSSLGPWQAKRWGNYCSQGTFNFMHLKVLPASFFHHLAETPQHRGSLSSCRGRLSFTGMFVLSCFVLSSHYMYLINCILNQEICCQCQVALANFKFIWNLTFSLLLASPFCVTLHENHKKIIWGFEKLSEHARYIAFSNPKAILLRKSHYY